MIGTGHENNNIELSDSTFWGESEDLPKDSGSFCISIYGYWLSAASQGGKVFPATMLSELPYEKIKSYSNWNTDATVTNVNYKNWKSGTRQHCTSSSSRHQRVFFINPSNSDHVPVQRFLNNNFHNVANDAVAQLEDPNPAWANIDDCGMWPCTAPDNAVLKFIGAKATGTSAPSITGITSSVGTTFQIIPNNPEAANFITQCTAVSAWNGYLCYNPKIGQIMFESLDDDKEDRTVSPINILGEGSSFNNTLNSFMDHCWDGHYTCQKRLSRFPGMVELNKNYEIYYTGSPPGNTRYMIQGADDGDWLHVKIDFSKSIVYKVYANDVHIPSKTYDQTLRRIPALTKSQCGENRYEQINYIYEFYLSKGCIVKLEAQEHLIGLARLQMSIDEFFADDFINRMAFALGISTDQIRVVSTQTGSTIIYYQITSERSTSQDQLSNLIELSDMLASRHAQGTLDLGAPILDLVNTVITSSGVTLTSGTGNYDTKDVHISVYILLAFSGIAVLLGFIYGIFKVLKISKTYKELANTDKVEFEKEANQNEPSDFKIENNELQNLEEVKSDN
jgi:hypothetical protein